jgi:Na+/H+ antiporter NhaD/arsenite permease-like protein
MSAPAFDWAGLGPAATAAAALPFGLLLAAIALLPTLPAAAAWWHRDANKLALASLLGLAGVLQYALPSGDWAGVGHAYLDYLAFVALLGSLFVITGGISVNMGRRASPLRNTALLTVGALLANGLGTTGAAMLLIRPLLRANRGRRHAGHLVVFFIFVVANCGGLLTPLGDPPLYLGFLAGVPFAWNLRMAKAWALVNGTLLLAFYLLERRAFARERPGVLAAQAQQGGLRIRGLANVLLLGLVMVAVLLSAQWVAPAAEAWRAGAGAWASPLFQALALGALAAASWRLTPRAIHAENQFTLHPMAEVGALFFGLFGAMLPALAILEARAAAIPLDSPAHYFWATGVLSAGLDNAPTYLTFASLAAVKAGVPGGDLGLLAARAPAYLEAVSMGAVFMGAMTYVGNGPNLMVRSVAARAHASVPSFGRYLLWSAGILLPLMLLCAWIIL